MDKVAMACSEDEHPVHRCAARCVDRLILACIRMLMCLRARPGWLFPLAKARICKCENSADGIWGFAVVSLWANEWLGLQSGLHGMSGGMGKKVRGICELKEEWYLVRTRITRPPVGFSSVGT
jgi:hypothetical protein